MVPSNYQIRGMHTILRDRATPRNDFVFYADRLNRVVVETGLGHLPFHEKVITTPTGAGIRRGMSLRMLGCSLPSRPPQLGLLWVRPHVAVTFCRGVGGKLKHHTCNFGSFPPAALCTGNLLPGVRTLPGFPSRAPLTVIIER